jgi:hypothetical protein
MALRVLSNDLKVFNPTIIAQHTHTILQASRVAEWLPASLSVLVEGILHSAYAESPGTAPPSFEVIPRDWMAWDRDDLQAYLKVCYYHFTVVLCVG